MDFTAGSQNIQNQLLAFDPTGRTALFDALHLGLEKIREARNDRKALIVITDGEDNSSRYTLEEVRDFAKESDAQIYTIGKRGELGYGNAVIAEISRLTGGRAFFPTYFNELDYFTQLIHSELRHRYLMGYLPSRREADGKWRKIRVNLNPPAGFPRLAVRTRDGYQASAR